MPRNYAQENWKRTSPLRRQSLLRLRIERLDGAVEGLSCILNGRCLPLLESESLALVPLLLGTGSESLNEAIGRLRRVLFGLCVDIPGLALLVGRLDELELTSSD
jgi:hypothetical protein